MSTTTEEPSVEEKIAVTMNVLKEGFIEMVTEQGSMDPVLILFDSKGDASMMPSEVQMQIFDKKHKSQFAGIVRSFIKFLKERENVEIIKTVILQNVYFVKKDPGYEHDNTKGVSEDKDAEQAVMIVIEDKTHLGYELYKAIYDDEETTAVISKEPIEECWNEKSDPKNRVESWMTGILD